MKPIKLIFKGINSFSEQTEIDFESLTKNGIFGIFGDTGSGKSTILDCINFALYGKVERSKEKLDIINYRSDAAEVKFEFDVIVEGKRVRYVAERNIKRKSGFHKAALYEDDKCIADNATTVTKKITEILGVDAEDFRKCIALPQGEFSQFVKSQSSERIALIERLFSLSKYGDRLKERLKSRESQSELAYQTIAAKLGLFGDVSEEIINSLEERIEGCKIQTERLSKESELSQKKFAALKVLQEKSAELKATVEQIAELEAVKQEMEELRAGQKAAPLCKSVVDTDAEICEKKIKISEINRDLLHITEDIHNKNERLKSAEIISQRENYDEKIAQCIALSAKYSSAEGKPDKLKEIKEGLDSKRKEYRKKEEELEKLNNKLKQAEEEVKATEKLLAENSSTDLGYIVEVLFKGAVLRDEYVNSLDYFVGLNGQVKFHKDNSELYKFMERELKQQIDTYKDRVFQVKDFNLADACEKLKNYQRTDETKTNLTTVLSEKRLYVKDVQSAVNECKNEIKIILRDGEALRVQYDELQSELNKIFGCKTDYASAQKENEKTLAALRNGKENNLTEIDKLNKSLSELSAQQAAKQTEKINAESDLVKLTEKLNNLIIQSGCESIEKCRKIAEEFDKFSDAVKTLDDYDKKFIALTARKAALEKNTEIAEFSEQALLSAEAEKNTVLSKLAQERENLAVLQSDCKKAKERVKEKNELKKELAKAEKERNLIAQLKELTKGNKFMEFIANEYLYDISSLASSTLLNLTDGRYFLTYKDTFYAGDNFNCGNLRGVNTLSGGETFLVSLSLALALSQTICASLKSIEFFFLDEGFGTLDGTLVDTVLNALEKLKSSHFTIGIISHVEELKHRIDNKITVYKATESRGSTVQLSC